MDFKIEEVKSDYITHVIKFKSPEDFTLTLDDVKLKRNKFSYTMSFFDDEGPDEITTLLFNIQDMIGEGFANTLEQEFKGHKFFYVSTTKKTVTEGDISSKDHVYFCRVKLEPNIFKKPGSDEWNISLRLKNVVVSHSSPKFNKFASSNK